MLAITIRHQRILRQGIKALTPFSFRILLAGFPIARFWQAETLPSGERLLSTSSLM